MALGLREGVHEGKDLVVLEDDRRGQLAPHDLGEDVVRIVGPVEAHAAVSSNGPLNVALQATAQASKENLRGRDRQTRRFYDSARAGSTRPGDRMSEIELKFEVTPEDLRRLSSHPAMAGPGERISLATVYKALEALVASGVATKLTAGDGSARYDARSEHHYHLRCLRSGSVQDLPTPFDPDLIQKLDPELTEILRGQGFQVTGYRLELIGFYEHEPAAAAVSREGLTDS